MYICICFAQCQVSTIQLKHRFTESVYISIFQFTHKEDFETLPRIKYEKTGISYQPVQVTRIIYQDLANK